MMLIIACLVSQTPMVRESVRRRRASFDPTGVATMKKPLRLCVDTGARSSALPSAQFGAASENLAARRRRGETPESFKFPVAQVRDGLSRLGKWQPRLVGGSDPVIAGVERTLDDMNRHLASLAEFFELPEGPRAA